VGNGTLGWAASHARDGLVVGKDFYQVLLPVFSRKGTTPLVFSVVLPKALPSPSLEAKK
jgi:hypothetical protein